MATRSQFVLCTNKTLCRDKQKEYLSNYHGPSQARAAMGSLYLGRSDKRSNTELVSEMMKETELSNRAGTGSTGDHAVPSSL